MLKTLIPAWISQPLGVTKISGGMTNENFCVQVAEEAFFVRLGGEGAEQLGIDRDVEYLATVTAGDLGVAPLVRHYLREQRILIADYVMGRTLSSDELSQPWRMEQVVELLQKIHHTAPAVTSFSVFHVIRHYWELVRSAPLVGRQAIEAVLSIAQRIEACLPFQPSGLCHNDLLAANFVLDPKSDRIWLVDWEYAGLGTPYFDLGNFASNQRLFPSQEETLARLYFKEPEVQLHVAAIRLMRVMSDLREALWGSVQRLVSPLDFDFEQYARDHFYRVQQALQSSAVEQALQILE
jgi:thiamine kinase-like enzyme